MCRHNGVLVAMRVHISGTVQRPKCDLLGVSRLSAVYVFGLKRIPELQHATRHAYELRGGALCTIGDVQL